MADIVVTDIDEQVLRQIEVRAILNHRTLQEELMLLIIDGLSEVYEPNTVRSAFRNATIELDNSQTLDERNER